MDVYVHRSSGFGHPENSVRALRAALASRVAGVAIDVRLTRDLKWVVPRGPARGERYAVRRMHEHTLRDLRREVWPLDEALALFEAFGDGKELLLDVRDLGKERDIVGMLERHSLLRRTVALAWEGEPLLRLHRLAPTLRLGLSLPAWRASAAVHREARRSGVSLGYNPLHTFGPGLSIAREQPTLSELPQVPLWSIQVYALLCAGQLVRDAHARGLRVVAFPANNRIALALLRRQGVDGVIANAPLQDGER